MRRPALTVKEQEYRALLIEQARSGLSIARFAEKAGVPAGTLFWWKSDLRRRDALREAAPSRAAEPAASPAFVPVRLLPSPEGTGSSDACRYEVVLRSGATVRVVGEVEEQGLARVLRAVVASC